jgi:hypothetical protein
MRYEERSLRSPCPVPMHANVLLGGGTAFRREREPLGCASPENPWGFSPVECQMNHPELWDGK